MKQHRSSGLATVLTDLVSEGHSILDLGPLSSSTTQAFLNRKCKCHVEDLVEYIDTLEPQDPNAIMKLDDHLLPKPENLKFKVILCWDLFNYLDLDVIEHLMKKLSPHLIKGTVLHMMRHVGTHMPAQPKRFRLLNDFHYELKDSGDAHQINTKSHSTVQLLKRMNKFSLRNTLMNQEGMQKDVTELLLEYDVDVADKHVHGVKQTQVVSYFSDTDNENTRPFKALTTGLSQISTIKSPVIFDIGKKIGRNMDYLNSLTDNLYVEDVFASISWQKKLHNDDHNVLSDHLLRFSEETKFNFVLAWDLFNFCLPFQVEKLGQLICSHLFDGALLHVVIFKNKGIPSKPSTFIIKDQSSVTVSGDTEGDGQRHINSMVGLMKLLPQFKIVDHQISRLGVGNSYQEILLQYSPGN